MNNLCHYFPFPCKILCLKKVINFFDFCPNWLWLYGNAFSNEGLAKCNFKEQACVTVPNAVERGRWAKPFPICSRSDQKVIRRFWSGCWLFSWTTQLLFSTSRPERIPRPTFALAPFKKWVLRDAFENRFKSHCSNHVQRFETYFIQFKNHSSLRLILLFNWSVILQ